jgi:hypothetical protein
MPRLMFTHSITIQYQCDSQYITRNPNMRSFLMSYYFMYHYLGFLVEGQVIDNTTHCNYDRVMRAVRPSMPNETTV